MKPVVFISSTAEDLKPYRFAARDAALRAGFFPQMMEYWVGRSNPPLAECLEKVEGARVVVVIVAHRYGWVPGDQVGGERKSITWLECEEALRQGKDVLAFIVDDGQEWSTERREEYRFTELGLRGELTPEHAAEIQDNVRRLGELKTWLGADRVLERFASPDDLARRVEGALRDWALEHPDAVVDAPAPSNDDPARYLEALYASTSHIDIRGLQVGTGRANRFPIEELYIPLSTALSREVGERHTKGRSEGVERGEIHHELQAALKYRKLVIVGDPGAGKTTFLNRIAATLCEAWLGRDPEAAERRLGLRDRPFPILIRVAELSEHIRCCRERREGPRQGETSAAWIEHYLGVAATENKLGLDEAFFRERLEGGETIVLLDGLDEAPSRTVRERISELVQNVAGACDGCRIVVTSRPAAYRDEVVLADFAHARIDPLEEAAIEGFLSHWCDALFHDSPDRARVHREELSGALHSRAEIFRMARNPVMLTALAVVHWNEKRLPEQRTELYESIITWLARSRERREGRTPAERSVWHLQNLAWAMQDAGRKRRVQAPRRWCAERIEKGLPGKNREERIRSAEGFLTEEELDSGIVVGRGSEVRFWHLTFQEFLAARALAGRQEEAQMKELLSRSKLYDSEWRETVLLFAGVLYGQGVEKVDGMVTAVLDGLGGDASLADRARCVGLLGAVLQDLSVYKYKPSDSRYRQVMANVMAIFDGDGSEDLRIKDAIAAAEALGLAGDPRFLHRERDKNWVRIEAGEFWMGAQHDEPGETNYDSSAFGREGPVHKVFLSSYDIGRYPVTVQEYREFIVDGGYARAEWWDAEGFGKPQMPDQWEEQTINPNRPVVGVSWFEAAAYAAWKGNGCRLSTEAEWERAARGTEGRKYPWGEQAPDEARSNCARSVGSPTPVGVYPKGATPKGIADLAGNVGEWCGDWYGDYASGRVENPMGPERGWYRAIRGGGFDYGASHCRSAGRDYGLPGERWGDQGFRLVRSI